MNISEELSKLNKDQYAGVVDESNVCVVKANVGSGKTTVLISKILYLHYVLGVDYRSITAVTFTNKAANEIKERLSLYEPDLNKSDFIGFGTFHGVALNLLREVLPVENIGYKHDLSVITPDEEVYLANEIILKNKLTVKYKNRLKKRLETGDISKYKDDFAKLIKILAEEKRLENKMDFNDLIYYASKLVDEKYVKPKWILVDEVQDIDSSQIEFIRKLKSSDTKLFVVGDPNQIIYSWRGVCDNVFDMLKSEFGAAEYTLPVNYRSSDSILTVANIFSENHQKIMGTKNKGVPVGIKEYYDAFQESQYIADKIEEIHKSGLEYSEIAVLYRLRKQAEIYEKALTRKNIPFKQTVRTSLNDIPVINWIINILRYSCNTNDVTSAVLVLTDKTYGMGLNQKQAVETMNFLYFEVPFKIIKRMLDFEETFKNENHLSAEMIYDYFNVDTYINPTSSSYISDRDYVMKFLKLTADKAALVEEESTSARIIMALNDIILDPGAMLEEQEENAVSLMTLHASKGLEFSYVFIVGVNNGLIPMRSNPEEIREEKRLFFVGVTRAKDNLELSYYTRGDNFRVLDGVSEFIADIVSETKTAEEQKHSLAELQRMLKNKNDEEKTEDIFNNCRRVRHEKYGEGTVIFDDGMIIKVDFGLMGEREFIKAFAELEEI